MDDLEAMIDDPAAATHHPTPDIRRLALSMLTGASEHLDLVARCLEDESSRVRAEAAEAMGAMGAVALPYLMDRTTHETEEIALEALAAALGEIEDEQAVPWLMQVAATDHDTLTRETAVASLGAVGDARALPLLLDLVVTAPPQVRRRTVVALTVFDGPEVEAAIRLARDDRNPMVREAAEMVVGRSVDEWVGIEMRGD